MSCINYSAVNDDDFLGRCGLDTNTFEDFKASEEVIFNIPNRTNAKLPLLKTVNEAVILTLDEIQQQNDSLNNGNTSFSSRIISNVPLLLIGILMRCSTFHTTFWISTSNWNESMVFWFNIRVCNSSIKLFDSQNFNLKVEFSFIILFHCVSFCDLVFFIFNEKIFKKAFMEIIERKFFFA